MPQALTPYQQYLKAQGKEGIGRPRRFDPEISKARQKEQTRRYNEARRRAYTVLAAKYREEYDAVFKAELAHINADAGPLPGDNDDS